MALRNKHIIFFIFFLFAINIQAQDKDTSENHLVQFSGVVVQQDSLTPIPHAHIIIKNSQKGTVSDINGYFSFVASQKDTILFTSVGFKDQSFIMPDTLTKHRYSIIQVMHSDTVQLKEQVVHPWPSKEQFEAAFMALDLADNDLQRARENLSSKKLETLAQNMPMGGNMNFRYEMQQQNNKLYYAGQQPPISILNPFAWAKFIKNWREGKFKNDDE